MGLQLVPCPICTQSKKFLEITVPDSDVHIQKYGLLYEGNKISQWKICGECGFVHQNPRPSVEALNEFYAKSNYHVQKKRETAEDCLSFSRWYFTEKIDFAIKNSSYEVGSIFDIGCGKGGVLKLFEERGWVSYGVEPDRNMADFAMNTLGLSGIKQGIFDSHYKLEDKVDLIFSNHAFEHFADLDEIMIGIQNILKQGGYLFIVVPTYLKNKSSLSKCWMNSTHYSLFTHNSLNNLLARYGFKEVIHTYSGWQKEVDDLWYLAKFTDEKHDPRLYYEFPKKVDYYLRIINPLRSFVFYIVYSNWALKARIYNIITNAFKLFKQSPKAFLKKYINIYCKLIEINKSGDF